MLYGRRPILPCFSDTPLVSGMNVVCLVLVQVTGRLNPFPAWTHRRGASASLGVVPWKFLRRGYLFSLMPPLRDDQYISISPTDSPGEDAGTDVGAAAPGPASHEGNQQVGKGLTRLPADTPRTPGPKNVEFQQFCDRLRTDLPGDSDGRGSFDTSTRFVAGDPGAEFGTMAPLEYEVTGETGRPHWELIFEYILRQCGYLVEFHTMYVMVDNRNLADHTRQDPSLPHWPAAVRWWHSRLKLIGPHKEKTELLLLFPISATTGLHQIHPTWAAPLSWLPWWQCSLGSISYCLIVIVYPSPCLKLKTCGQKLFWPDFQRIHQGTPLRLSTHSIVSAALGWGRVHLWLLSRMLNSMLGLL